jgi:hypothetical protein
MPVTAALVVLAVQLAALARMRLPLLAVTVEPVEMPG